MHFRFQSRLAAVYLAFLPVVNLAGCSKGKAAPSTVHAAGPADVRPAESGSVDSGPADPRVAEYKAHVEPVLQANCLRCHGGMNRRGGLNMSTRAALLQGGKDGAVVIPGRPEDSLLIKLVGPGLAESDPMRMPPKGARLSAADIDALRKWIADGAAMDR